MASVGGLENVGSCSQALGTDTMVNVGRGRHGQSAVLMLVVVPSEEVDAVVAAVLDAAR